MADVGKLVWKVLGTGAAIGAGLLARKFVTVAWRAGTGTEPPSNPEDPDVSWKEALGWAVGSGAVIGVARLLATRKAAAYYAKSAGHPPQALRRTG